MQSFSFLSYSSLKDTLSVSHPTEAVAKSEGNVRHDCLAGDEVVGNLRSGTLVVI